MLQFKCRRAALQAAWEGDKGAHKGDLGMLLDFRQPQLCHRGARLSCQSVDAGFRSQRYAILLKTAHKSSCRTDLLLASNTHQLSHKSGFAASYQ